MENVAYEKQNRGSQGEYENYYAGMDKSMAQKVALVTSYLALRGRVADMGSGSGKGSYDLAKLFPQLKIIGVDINPESVKYSGDNYKAKNLSFKKGDIAEKIFRRKYLDAIINSSVLHHVTSFNDFDVQRIFKLLDSHVDELCTGGIIAIRDFVIPKEDKNILIELPVNDGVQVGSPKDLSTAALFEVFCRDFNCANFPKGNLPYLLIKETKKSKIFRVNNRLATEFLLRKDYREDWDVEMLEEYLYFTQMDFEREMLRRSLRILISRPIYNEWIIRNRWNGKAHLFEIDKTPLGFPATNYIIVGKKVPHDHGVVIREKSAEVGVPKFLKISHYQHKETGQQWDVASRPGETIDVIPWFVRDGELYIVARSEFPRPITQARGIDRPIDGAFISGYIPEPLTVVHLNSDNGKESIETTIRVALKSRANISSKKIKKIESGPEFFPSAGATAERVSTYYVEIESPRKGFEKSVQYETISHHQAKEFNVNQLIRAYKVGGMVDVRLEIAAYELLERLGINYGPWIEQAISTPVQSSSDVMHPIMWNDFAKGIVEKKFSQIEANNTSYLEVRQGLFAEYTSNFDELRDWKLEYIIPKTKSINTVTVLPVTKSENEWYIALESQHLAPVQELSGQSGILTVPAWRLPLGMAGLGEARTYIDNVMKDQAHAVVYDLLSLGGSYFPSPGISPEYVLPFIAYIQDFSGSKLKWVSLKEVFNNRHLICDGHLLVSMWRAIHMLSEIKE